MRDSAAREVTVRVNGRPVSVPAGASVAVAVLLAGRTCRTSVTGEARAPLCGMGTCFECRVTINGEAQRRSCQTLCQPDMEISAHE
ncbi:MAG TPA: (2Fe-2S)-binding protein [Candidatus Acidoferrales bacterium]|nr:(2Fe-2S)-binding protein [Candidatus Acidoferrales bacterium]